MAVETLIWLSRPAAKIVVFIFFMEGRRNCDKESEGLTKLPTEMYRNLSLISIVHYIFFDPRISNALAGSNILNLKGIIVWDAHHELNAGVCKGLERRVAI